MTAQPNESGHICRFHLPMEKKQAVNSWVVGIGIPVIIMFLGWVSIQLMGLHEKIGNVRQDVAVQSEKLTNVCKQFENHITQELRK